MMAITVTEAMWFLPFALPICVWVAWNDMKYMKIPNKAVLALMVVFAVIGLIALPFTDYLWRLAHFAVVLVAGFVLNMVRVMGAGDAKFAAAMAPFVVLDDLVRFFALLACVTVAAFLIHRLFRAIPAVRKLTPDWKSWELVKKFPMGLALGGTLALYLALGIVAGA